jgi:hypothetical protein
MNSKDPLKSSQITMDLSDEKWSSGEAKTIIAMNACKSNIRNLSYCHASFNLIAATLKI